MHGRGRSDSPVVPRKPPNKGGGAPSPAEGAEGRGLAKGNPGQQSKSRTQSRTGADRARPTRARSGKPRLQPRDGAYVRSADLSHALDRIRQAAAKDRGQRFTALWHHVYDVGRLREEYYDLKPRAAPGVDGETWQEYGENLEARLQDLSERLRRGAYRAQPVRRVYIPKAYGLQRPIGVPALEDKLVQRSATAVLQAVYEVDFKAYGPEIRRGWRKQSQAPFDLSPRSAVERRAVTARQYVAGVFRGLLVQAASQTLRPSPRHYPAPSAAEVASP